MADPSTVRKIAALSGAGSGDHVLEIGAGLGSLTLALAETGAHVVAVEIDNALVGALRHVTTGIGLVDVVHGDARTLDYRALLERSEQWLLVANLPYNIATPLVLDLLRNVMAIHTMVVMMQREAAERLVALPGSRARGIPSVLVERQATAQIVASVRPEVFVPRPKVESAVVRINRRASTVGLDSADVPPTPAEPYVFAPPGQGQDRLEQIVRIAFGQRRKMLRRSLAGCVNSESFAAAGVDPTARPETLTLQQWTALAAIQTEDS